MNDQLPVHCPRCGHSLEGQRAAWRTACPLAGRCPECGLDVAWGEVLGGRFDHPRWCVEGAPGLIAWGWRLVPNAFMATVRPRALLRRLRMEHAIRPGRLASSLLALVVVLALVGWGMVAVSYVRQGVPAGAALRASVRLWDGGMQRLTLPLPAPGSTRVAYQHAGRVFLRPEPSEPAAVVLPADAVVPPSGFDVTDASLPLVEVRTARGHRIFVSATSGMLPDANGHPTRRLVVSAADVMAARGVQSAPMLIAAPRGIIGFLLGPVVEITLIAALPLVATAVTAAGAFAVLPIARRRARVRWGHLGRLSVYAALGSACLCAVLIGLAGGTGRLAPLDDVQHRLGFDAVAAWMGRPNDAGFLAGAWFACGLPVLFGSIWWSMAAHHYLRMARPVAVGVSVAIVANLMLLTVVVFGLQAWR